ncbi:cerato-platanin like protein [Metarhizium robertsii]|uniref:Eliciting plant response-like protein n=4 Tax=Hypocreales TaxID=5125 RepID=A0A0D9NQV8_METAN
MQFSGVICAAIMAVTASAVRVSWDSGYDRADRSLTDVSCSDGKTGMMPKYQKQGDLPNFPNIGGADAIAGWGSPNCGSCWRLDYEGMSIKVLAIDHAGNGFNIGQTAMNALTNGRAVEFGQVDATATRLTPGDCGL